MSVVSAQPVPLWRPRVATALVTAVASVASLGAVGLLLAFVLYRYPPPFVLVVGFVVGIVSTLALALVRYEAAVGLGFVLLAVVWVEPAPPDLVFAVVITLAVVTGRVALRRVPPGVTFLVGGFLALNLLSSIEVVDGARAGAFFAITLYLAVFGLWLAVYVDSSRRARLVVRSYLAGAVVSALASSLALFASLPGGHLLAEGSRAHGLFKDPNVFGPFLVPAALIAMEELLSPRLLRSGRPLKLALFLVLTVGVFASYSRAAWLNYGVGVGVLLVVFALRRGGARHAVGAVAIIVTALTVVTAVVEVTGSGEFFRERARVQRYDESRFGGQLVSLRTAERYPLGIGPGQFEEAAGIAAHSTYARTAAEQGALGLAVLVALLLL
ncbi:MAG TPA: O-antigen ligase family protein, partial [Gaiellaceae bacterium]|nr:O-antigen ligase family protein [Gaiellaceae bacterium]